MSAKAVSAVAIVVLLTTRAALAQLPVPQLQVVFPIGARQGTSVECTIAGQDLTGAADLYFSHAGITAERLADNRFQVTVASDVPVGRYDVRAVCATGVSTFRTFVVGDRDETLEQEPNNSPAEAARVTLPVAVEGRIDGGIDVDFVVFTAKRGQRVLINCWAWRYDSPLDATLMLFDATGKELAYSGDYYGKDPLIDFTAPADGDYTVKVWDFVYGSASSNVYRLEIDSLPHLDAIQPAVVQPGIETQVTLFGRNLPGGKPAEEMSILGKPLEQLTQAIRLPAKVKGASTPSPQLHGGEAIRPAQTSVDGSEYRLPSAGGMSNPVFVGFAQDPVVLEREPNDAQADALRVPIPCEVSGCCSRTGDRDFYAFSLKKGEKVIVEVFGERQSGLLDPILTGFDSTGKRLKSADDNDTNIGQIRFTTRSHDGRWDFDAPADGEFFVSVRDLYFEQRGDQRFGYRLSVRQPRPDFRLLAVPISETQPDVTVVGRGGNHWLDVLAFRDDGFDEPIVVSTTDLPPGVTCESVTIGPGKTSVPLVFHAAADAPLTHRPIRITGRAKLGEMDLVRDARGGSLVWATVNTPGIARLADSIVLSVRDAPPFSIRAKAQQTSVPAGGKLTIDVQTARAKDWTGDLQLAGFELPSGAVMALKTIGKGTSDGRVELVLAPNARPGTYSFIVQASGQVPRNYATEPDPQRRANNVRVLAPSNPLSITITDAKR